MDEMGKNKVKVLILPPHSSHVLQPLDVVLFAPLKNTHVELEDISSDEEVNVANVMLNKYQKSFTSSLIVKSFEKVCIYHRSEGKNNERRSYFMVDTSKIDENNHIRMSNVLKDLKCIHQNDVVKLDLDSY